MRACLSVIDRLTSHVPHLLPPQTVCPQGTYNAQAGADSSSLCLACPSGSYGPSQGQPSCQPCSAGLYGLAVGGTAAATACAACPSGSYQPLSGQPLNSSCISCAPGTYAASPGSSMCTPCGLGLFSDAIGSSSSATCSPCSEGTYNPVTGQSSAGCLSCPSGTFSNSTGATGQYTCIACEAGTASGAKAGACDKCPPGTWADRQATSCTACARGTYSGAVAASSILTCNACPNGTSTLNAGSSSVADCTGAAFSCPSGQQINLITATATSAGECIPLTCSAPLELNAAGTACTGCAKGTFRNASGVCTSCPQKSTCIGILTQPVHVFSTALVGSASLSSSKARRAAATCFSWSSVVANSSVPSIEGTLSSYESSTAPSKIKPVLDPASYYVVYVGGIFIAAMLLVFTIAELSTSETARFISWCFERQDAFDLQHLFWSHVGDPLYRRKTSPGGLLSVLSYIVILIVREPRTLPS